MKNLNANKIIKNNGYSLEEHLNYFYETIENAILKIDKVIIDTEKKFLNIGDNLQKNYTITKDITNSAANSANILSGEKMLENIKRLTYIMDNSGNYLSSSLSEIKSGEKILGEVLQVLNRAVDNLGGFNRIVKHLRMLGISTKIESSRLNIEDSGFTAIADNVEKLSTIINDKAADIKEKAFYLIKIILAAQSKITNLHNLQNEQSNLIINNTRSSFNSLLSRHNNYSEKSKLISDISEKVSFSISEIVSSIQSHDITRQQLENIKIALSEVLGSINNSLVQSKAFLNTKESYLHLIFDICVLQSEQLICTKDEFLKAVFNINQSLNTIDESLSELSDNILQISSNEFNNRSFITEIEIGLNQTSTELNKNFNINSELAASMKSVADTVGSLNSYVHEIDEIGTEVEMIALNARVKAAHTGSEGAALGVLAESIQRLSGDARAHTIQMSEILTQIMKIAETLKDNNGMESRNIKKEEIQNLNNGIELILRSLKEIDGSAVNTIVTTKDSIFNVKKSVSTVINEFQIQGSIDQDISDVIKSLEEFTGIIKKFYITEGSFTNKNLEELKSQHTTSSEQSIYEKLSSVKKMIKKDINPKSLTQKNYSELGENIELF